MDECLEIRTLGSPEIFHNGEPVNLITQKTTALLIYLACTERPHARPVLAEMLWPERDPSQSLTNLRVVLNDLRATLDPFLLITNKTLGINLSSNVWVDMHEFETRISALTSNLNTQTALELEHVLELYRGDFLEGFSIDSRDFEDWALLKREQLQLLMLNTLNQIVTYYTQVKDYSAAIRWANRSLQIDTLREETHRQLMLLLAVSGQQRAALDQFEMCKRLLKESLAVEPDPETIILVEQIQSGEIIPPQSTIRLSGVISGALIRNINDFPARASLPKTLIGRDEIKVEIESLITENKRILLQGFSGVGKTALAAAIVADYVQSGQLPVVWLQIGNEQARAVLDALGTCLGAGSIADAQQLSHLLNKQQVKLIVLDDAWNGSALDQVIAAIPTTIPIVVTSRSRFPLLHNITIPMLPRQSALELLSHHAKINWKHNVDANQICQLLGDLPFSIRIAGEMLALDKLHPTELLNEIFDKPHMVQMPSGFEENQNLPALLQASLEVLEDQDRTTFMSFGRLFARGATSALLALVMQQDEQTVSHSLRMLQRRGLADKENWEDPKLAYYSIHDLAFSYAKSEQNPGPQIQQITQEACLQFAKNHKETPEIIHAEQGNILGAAQSAYLTRNYPLLIELMRLLTNDSQYLTTYGHTLYLTERTDEAILAAREMGDQTTESLHYLLSKRGNMYYERGNLVEALDCYQEAGEIAQQLNMFKRHILALCVTSKVRSELGDVEAAHAGLERAYQLATDANDTEMLARVLENWAVHAETHGDYQKAKELSEQEVELGNQNNDQRMLFNAIYNLGSTEQKMGNFEGSVPLLLRALEIAETENNIRWRAASMHLLGVAYDKLDDCDEALRLLKIALELFRQSGITTQVKAVEDLIQKISKDCNSRSNKD